LAEFDDLPRPREWEPLPVGAVELGWIGVTAAGRGAAASAALSDAAGGDVPEIGEFGCQLAVTTLVAG
jgi:hypothetical protein